MKDTLKIVGGLVIGGVVVGASLGLTPDGVEGATRIDADKVLIPVDTEFSTRALEEEINELYAVIEIHQKEIAKAQVLLDEKEALLATVKAVK